MVSMMMNKLLANLWCGHRSGAWQGLRPVQERLLAPSQSALSGAPLSALPDRSLRCTYGVLLQAAAAAAISTLVSAC